MKQHANNNKCQTGEQLINYFSQQLSEEEELVVESHLSACEHCSNRAGTAYSLVTALDEWITNSIEETPKCSNLPVIKQKATLQKNNKNDLIHSQTTSLQYKPITYLEQINNYSQFVGLHPLILVAIFVDWLLFFGEIATSGLSLIVSIIIGILTIFYTTVLQKRRFDDNNKIAVLKGLFVGLVIAFPTAMSVVLLPFVVSGVINILLKRIIIKKKGSHNYIKN